MIYHFRLHKDEDGMWAECVEMDNVFSQGETLEELKFNLSEALEGILRSNLGNNYAHPLPDSDLNGDENLIQIEVSPDLAFSILLRHYRINRHRTQDNMRQAMGMKSRNSYVKLEKEGNPTLKTIGRILKVFPDFPITQCF